MQLKISKYIYKVSLPTKKDGLHLFYGDYKPFNQ